MDDRRYFGLDALRGGMMGISQNCVVPGWDPVPPRI